METTKTKCNISFMYANGKIGEKHCDTHDTRWEGTERPETCKQAY